MSSDDCNGSVAGGVPRKTFAQAATQIIIADVSMSLDNVLAVAGAAHGHPSVLIIGLVLSIALMGLASTFIARIIHKYRWIAYVGLLVILYVSIEMIYEGYREVRYGREAAHAEEVLETTDTELQDAIGAEAGGSGEPTGQ